MDGFGVAVGALAGCLVGADAGGDGFGVVVEAGFLATFGLPWARASAHDRTGGLLGGGDGVDDGNDDDDANSILGDAWCDDDDDVSNVLVDSALDTADAGLAAGEGVEDNADLLFCNLARSSRALRRTYFRRGGNASPGLVYHGSWSYVDVSITDR